MAKQKTFKSIDEVVKAYWPEELLKPQAEAGGDPTAAGERLGRRVVEAFGRELAARLRRTRS